MATLCLRFLSHCPNILRMLISAIYLSLGCLEDSRQPTAIAPWGKGLPSEGIGTISAVCMPSRTARLKSGGVFSLLNHDMFNSDLHFIVFE
jgi:hypothetical protein